MDASQTVAPLVGINPGVTIFFFTVSAMAFFEAMKLEGRRASVSWAIFGLFSLAGLLTLFPSAWPAGVGVLRWFGGVAESPFTWAVLLLLAYLMWRERHLPAASAPAPVMAPPAPQADGGKLKQLSDRLSVVEDELHAPKAPDPSDDDRHELEAKIEAVAASYEARERLAVVKKHLEELTKHLTAPPARQENGEVAGIVGPQTIHQHLLMTEARKQRAADQEFERVRGSLRSLGFPMDGWDDAVKAAEEQIKGDASYLNILPSDANFAWSTPEEKRRWYLDRAKLEAKLNFLSALSRQYEEKADYLRAVRPRA